MRLFKKESNISLGIIYSPSVNERLQKLKHYEGVSIDEIILRAVVNNSHLVEEKAKSICICGQKERRINDGYIQDINKSFNIFAYKGLTPDIQEMKIFALKILGDKNILSYKMNAFLFNTNIIKLVETTDINWSEAIRKSLWNYSEIRLTQVRSINQEVKFLRNNGSSFEIKYPEFKTRRG